MTKKIILLINRERVALDQISSLLKKAGYDIHTADDLRGALSVLSSCSVGLIICDYRLKDVSGLEFINFIKKDPLREKIPFMFLVSTKDQGNASKAFKLGAEDYLVYPLEPEILIDRIDEVFSATGLAPMAQDASPPELPSTVEPAENTAHFEPITAADISVDVSRDSVIWLPGKIVKFDDDTLFIETSLFGKPDMFLMTRIKLNNDVVILNGNIKNITYEDFQKPACIEIAVQKEEVWFRIHGHLIDKGHQKNDSLKTDGAALESETASKAIHSSQNQPDKTIIQTGSFKPADTDISYDKRFYHSIIGKQLENYRAITLISTSEMGGLIQGWDVAQEREVALKVISYELSSQPAFREAFIKKIQAVSKLSHRNIAQIFAVGTSDDILYYAMEFVDGQSFNDIIDRMGCLNPVKGVEYLISVCETLQYLHQNGIMHHGLKPASIMVDGAGTVKIIDFGVGFSDDPGKKNKKGRINGSWEYMPPEQITGSSLDCRSDIYSAGAAFYHVLTDTHPFTEEDFAEIIAGQSKTPPPMLDKNPDIPVQFINIIEKMMCKDPSGRYESFKSVLNDAKTLYAQITTSK